MRRTKSGGYPTLPHARGRALTALAAELGAPRAGLLERLPWLGDWIVLRRVQALMRLRRLSSEFPRSFSPASTYEGGRAVDSGAP